MVMVVVLMAVVLVVLLWQGAKKPLKDVKMLPFGAGGQEATTAIDDTTPGKRQAPHAPLPGGYLRVGGSNHKFYFLQHFSFYCSHSSRHCCRQPDRQRYTL